MLYFPTDRIDSSGSGDPELQRLQILLQTVNIAGDRPPHYVTSGVFRLILKIMNILQILLQA